tara:strand:+ start:1662 stop:2048 length:387 start_codon:yes stop_codon:yes gene_type:complete
MEEFDPDSVIALPKENEISLPNLNRIQISVEELTKDEILNHMEIVIKGICNSIHVPNTLSSWKITVRGLTTIRHIEKDFYLGVNMWLNITQNNIISCNNNEILESMKNEFSWINDLLIIKRYMNKNYP